MSHLPSPFGVWSETIAHGASDFGAVIVGSGGDNLHQTQACRWLPGGGPQGLGFLAGGQTPASIAHAVSADGRVIVGLSSSQPGRQAFRWTEATGMQGLGDLPGGGFESRAVKVSADGLVIVGTGKSAFGTEAFRWTAGGGMVGLGDLPGGSFHSSAEGVSGDGSVVVGSGSSSLGLWRAFRWTAATGMVDLGNVPGMGGGIAAAVSGDGDRIVGLSTSPPTSLPLARAFIWDSFHGMVDLKAFLVGRYNLPVGPQNLDAAYGISSDGRTIAGITGTRGWVAYLGPCDRPADVTASDGTICGYVRVGWSPAEEAADYAVWRAPNANGGGAVRVAIAAASPYFDADAPPGVPQWYFVQGRNSRGAWGPLSLPDTGFIPSIAAPAGVQASDGTRCGFVRVSWDAVPGATGYSIWRGASGNSASAVQVGTATAGPFWDVPPSGAVYYYFVRSVNTCGAGALSTGDRGHRAPCT